MTRRNGRESKTGTIVMIILAILLWTFIMTQWLGGCRDSDDVANQGQEYVLDNFTDVLDVQYLGTVKAGAVTSYDVIRATDMDNCQVIYIVGGKALEPVPVTSSMTNSFGKLGHCFTPSS